MTVALAAAAVVFTAGILPAQEFDQARSTVDEEGVETLLQGPVHEAFAKPVEGGVEPGPVVPKEPPEPINELPPEAKPAGEDSVWIPGYWAWEQDRDDFLWVSGVWRVPPPDHRWVPGYWIEAEGGYQWLSGFWQPTEVAQVTYLPLPPENVDEGPNSPAPAEDYFWVSGSWVYQDQGYAWRPGYWSPY
jgi:hypothetical protein